MDNLDAELVDIEKTLLLHLATKEVSASQLNKITYRVCVVETLANAKLGQRNTTTFWC